MAGADLKVTIDGDAAKLERALARAGAATLKFEGQLARANTEAAQLDQMLNAQRAQALNTLGRGMLAFGAATLAGLGLATKAAIEWESAWAGVRKTVDGSDAEMAALEAELRNLTTILPASHREIAAVAEAAGQLGVARQDIAAFTRVMIDLGETTNLTADEAATSIAQLMNVMGTAPADVGRLGAALVDLGNNGASTEADIVQMAQRIAGAGNQIGLTEAEVLGFGNALASVGIEAEAGGTAISRVMSEIASSVASGGDAVQGFADVAGLSAEQFSTAFRDNPAAAINAFVVGLDRISSSGGNVFAVLQELGLGEIRVRDALLRLSGAGNLLAESLDLGARAWEENTALVDEAAKRYDTTAAKIEIAKNGLVDLAIDVGNVVLPALSSVAEVGADLLQAFGQLPGPFKAAVTLLGGLAGVAATVGGGFLLLAPRIAAARAEMVILARTAPVLAGSLIAVGQAAKVALPLLAVATAIAAVVEASRPAPPAIGATTEALLDLADGVETQLIAKIRESHQEIVRQRQGLQDAKNSWTEYKDSFAGTDLDDIVAGNREFADQIGSVDTALAQLVAGGNAEKADEVARAFGEALGLSAGEMDQVLAVLPQYADALASADANQQLATESAGPLNDSLVTLAEQFGLTGDDAAAAAQDMLDAWSGAASEFVTLTSDMIETVDEYLAALEEQVAAQLSWEANMLAISSRVPAAMLDELARLGPEGAEEVALMAQMTEAELARAVEIWATRTGEGADAIAQRLAEAQPVLAAIAQRHGQVVADRVAAGMAQNSSSVFEEAKRQGVLIDQGVGTNRVRRAPIAVDVTGIGEAERQLNNLARNRATAIRVTVSTGVRVAGFTGQGGTTFQHGTDFAPGGVALVGEAGPELVEIPRGSRVHDTATTRAILSNPSSFVGAGSGNAGQIINVHNEVIASAVRSPLLFAAMREVTRLEIGDVLREMQMQRQRGGRV